MGQRRVSPPRYRVPEQADIELISPFTPSPSFSHSSTSVYQSTSQLTLPSSATEGNLTSSDEALDSQQATSHFPRKYRGRSWHKASTESASSLGTPPEDNLCRRGLPSARSPSPRSSDLDSVVDTSPPEGLNEKEEWTASPSFQPPSPGYASRKWE